MVTVTKEMLKQICPQGVNTAKYVDHLNKYMPKYEINTPIRVAHFLGQVAHESGQFNYVKELASGEAYDTGAKAKMLGNTPEKDGDGQRFKGRGLIQITGQANYKSCSKYIFGNENKLIAQPELLEQPEFSVESACWFWSIKANLNKLADADQIEAITRKINGGFNGMDDRKLRTKLAKKCLGL